MRCTFIVFLIIFSFISISPISWKQHASKSWKNDRNFFLTNFWRTCRSTSNLTIMPRILVHFLKHAVNLLYQKLIIFQHIFIHRPVVRHLFVLDVKCIYPDRCEAFVNTFSIKEQAQVEWHTFKYERSNICVWRTLMASHCSGNSNIALLSCTD